MSKPTIEMTSSKKETQTLLPRRDLLSAALALGVVVGLSRSEALFAASAGRVESRLAELGITLPAAPAPLANYVAYVVEGNVAYIAGQIPMNAGELMYPGKVPTQVTVEQARAAARQCGINILAALKSACGGDLDRVRRCVRLQGFIASADDFTAQPTVINAASDLMVEVFGDAGKHTRLALGSNVLPLDSCVEISAMFVLNP
jgi:enamine deaminase RidA (YjgF/YER057c/UK114 family)